MAHKPFNIYKRPTTKNGNYIYYVQYYTDSIVAPSYIEVSYGQTGPLLTEK